MAGKEIRVGQLLAPFGPGSIYIDNYGIPLIIAGVDHWLDKYSESGSGWEACDDKQEFLIIEERLSKLVGIKQFYSPPAYKHIRKGDTDVPKNSGLKISAFRFPTWYTNNNGALKKFNLSSKVLEPKTERWRPVRFVVVCNQGHISDFPWKKWIDCNCDSNNGLKINDMGGADLSSIRVTCNNCKKSASLSGATARPVGDKNSPMQRAGISCKSHRPWLDEVDEDDYEECTSPLVGALINQTNLYYPKLLASIFIPPIESDPIVSYIQNIFFEQHEVYLTAKTNWGLLKERSLGIIKEILCRVEENLECSEEQIKSALDGIEGNTNRSSSALPQGVESQLLNYRRDEFNTLRNELISNEITELKIVPAQVATELEGFINRVNLIERLRETRVFLGFERLETDSERIDPLSMAEDAIHQLFKVPPNDRERWLPAIKTYGEGIYLELNSIAIDHWIQSNSIWLNERFDDQFIARLAQSWLTLAPIDGDLRSWAYRYLLVHTIAHLLIKEVVYDCGYSTAALRERLYVSADPEAPMAGILIYTASGDSEGSLGGLVRLGHPDAFLPIVQKALRRATWCSADPVCSENYGAQGAGLMNMSACHACCLLPETACEAMNHGLDRALVVGTPENRKIGFMANFVD